MMNKRFYRQIIEMVLAGAFAVILAYLGKMFENQNMIYFEALSLLSLIWITLRHGAASGIISGALSGLCLSLMTFGFSQLAVAIVLGMFPYLSVGLAGFFSKYSQKTLNNSRYSSTYLNIFTASFLVTLVFTILRTHILMQVVELAPKFMLTDMTLWLNILGWSLFIGLILSILARLNPKSIIPKRSKYLSRHETSSLLND